MTATRWLLFACLVCLLHSKAAAQNPCLFQGEHTAVPSASSDAGDTSAMLEVKKEVDGLVRGIGGLRMQAFPVEGLGNACASRASGRRLIYYDTSWLQRYTEGKRWVVVGVISHEIGHILYEHGPSDGMAPWRREYEADIFTGQTIAGLGGSEAEAVSAAEKQPVDATNDYPSRAVRIATVIEGYKIRQALSNVVSTSGQLPSVPFTLRADDKTVMYVVDGAIFYANIIDYQDHRRIDSRDITRQSYSVAIRLGRDNDMMMFSAFNKVGNQICAKNLFMQIRDGDDIAVEKVSSSSAEGEFYGIRYGRNKDLYNVIGVRARDFEFVFDPRAPRTGTNRNPQTKVSDSISKGAKGIYIEDLACKSRNDWAWSRLSSDLSAALNEEYTGQNKHDALVAALSEVEFDPGRLENAYRGAVDNDMEKMRAFRAALNEDPARVRSLGAALLGQ